MTGVTTVLEARATETCKELRQLRSKIFSASAKNAEFHTGKFTQF